ncbi:MAG: hypothetical protein AB1635_13725 [Acidobacteriota bacterium]
MRSSYSDGLGRVRRAPWVVAGTYVATVLMAVPLALTLRGMMMEHLGASLAAGAAARGVNFDWWNEFLAQSAGLGQTFVPAILGFAAVLKNLSTVADAEALPTVIASAVVAHAVLSLFLAGGILDRLARNRVVGAAAFFSACGVYFFRFLRLGLVAGLVYWQLFTRVHPWLFDEVLADATRDITVERTAFVYRLGFYALFGAAVLAVNVVMDYAKIRAVVEDRRSMLGALAASLRFIRHHPGAAVGLYLANTLLFLAVVAAYAVAVPPATAPVWAIVGAGQLYILLRVIVRLQFAASQTALFQSRLAHAGYTAAPVPKWPDSPAVEAVSAAGPGATGASTP